MPKPIQLQLQPAPRERLGDILYGQILEQIASGAFAEGDRLPSEAAISAAFKVSRPVVREALMRLQADGLVYARQGSGSYVKSRPSARITEFAEAADIAGYLRTFEPRIVLEAEAARLAALRRTEAQLAAIHAAVDALETAIAAGTAGPDEDFAFHRAIAEASGNDVFPQLLDAMRSRLGGSMAVALGLTRAGSEYRRRHVVEEHRQIAEAIAGEDAEAAALYMRYHLTRARERMTDAQRDA